jgi:arginase family enzyme
VEDRLFLPHNVNLVGIGDAEREELEYLKNLRIPYFPVSSTSPGISFLQKLRWSHAVVFISIDVDVLDPAFLPCTGTPRGGGWTTRELLNYIKRIRDFTKCAYVVWCITEAFHDPAIDPACITLNTVESIVREIAVEH